MDNWHQDRVWRPPCERARARAGVRGGSILDHLSTSPPASSTLAEEVMAVNASGPFTIWQRCDAAVSSITPLLAPRQLHGQSLNQRPVKPRPSDHSPQPSLSTQNHWQGKASTPQDVIAGQRRADIPDLTSPEVATIAMHYIQRSQQLAAVLVVSWTDLTSLERQ